jgi:putative FmdB family regulatory protein
MDYRSNGCGVMPDYSFECELDGLFDRIYAMGQAPQTIVCPVCGDEAKRRYNAIPAILKGSGWGKNG